MPSFAVVLRPGIAFALLACVLVVAGCGSAGDALPVVVSAPVSSQPWIASSIRRGAQLAVDDLNARGGVRVGNAKRELSLLVLDNGGSPANALANARTAVSKGALALVTDGTGAASMAAVTDPANLPVFICFDGGAGLIDPGRRPTLFRMAPADATLAGRLADYIANAKPRVALLTDDSGYGQQGRAAVTAALRKDQVPVVSDQTVQQRAADVTPQVLAARRAGAQTLVLWTSAADIAAVLQATHAIGWDVPVISGQTGEDPLVRQRLVAHPDWLKSLRFVSSRITAEVGPKPFERFRAHYEAKLGVDKVGVSQDGRPVLQPPDWAMYSYDALNLVAEALDETGALGASLMRAMGTASIVGANGDSRGYSPTYHEGISPSDMYFARFDGFQFEPVGDDPLSGSLPAISQLGH
ncbi:ABC transporter substrate-binding protein [Candidatus Solirubrobacter pratensis]|uniref:ABC transporter substrate-binding protein n=1 Tax=Candidatus Solirubrobacter pratensis TaxID=1298857 RepID=UPI0003F7A4BC|nr:ABC transporter substrate-binding protein [Candidatus Solirubrobacter pratensis]